jgi:hypothetical protein
MAGLTNYAKEKILEHFFNAASTYTAPTTVYLGLDTVLGTEAGGGTEVVGTGYVRAAITFGAYASRRIASDVQVNFAAGSAWGTVVGFRIWDQASGGNAMAFGRVQPSTIIGAGDAYSLGAGEVIIDLANTFPFGPFLAQRILEHLFRNAGYSTLAGSLWMHLVTTRPDNDGVGGVALSASGYSSKAATFAAYASGRCFLSSDISFSASAPAAWGTIPAWVLRDNAAFGSGNFLAVGDLSPVPTFATGAPVVLDAASTFIGLIQGSA